MDYCFSVRMCIYWWLIEKIHQEPFNDHIFFQEPYPDIVFSLKLRRKTLFYTVSWPIMIDHNPYLWICDKLNCHPSIIIIITQVNLIIQLLSSSCRWTWSFPVWASPSSQCWCSTYPQTLERRWFFFSLCCCLFFLLQFLVCFSFVCWCSTYPQALGRRWIFLSSAWLMWQLHDNHMTITWQLHDNYMTITWRLQENFMKITWQLHDNYMTIHQRHAL